MNQNLTQVCKQDYTGDRHEDWRIRIRGNFISNCKWSHGFSEHIVYSAHFTLFAENHCQFFTFSVLWNLFVVGILAVEFASESILVELTLAKWIVFRQLQSVPGAILTFTQCVQVIWSDTHLSWLRIPLKLSLIKGLRHLELVTVLWLVAVLNA